MAFSSIADLLPLFDQLGRETAYVFRRGYRTQRWSYAQIAHTARQFASELSARNIAHGDRIVLWGSNCAEWVAAFFGCAWLGAVAVPIDRASTSDFVSRICAQVSGKLIVCDRVLQTTAPHIPQVALEDLADTIAARPERTTPPRLSRDDVLEIIFTSGTTAEPKGVVLTHGNVLANLEPLQVEIAKYLKYERWVHPLRFVDLLPLSHVFGQFLGLYVPQAMGATVVFHDSLNPAEVIATIRRERASVCIAVPRMLESLQHHVERDYATRGERNTLDAEISAAQGQPIARRMWRFRRVHRDFGWKFWAFISGGAALGQQTERFWRTLGFVVVQGYGLTETTSLISANHPFRTGERSIGKLLPGREVKLAPDGEILVRGENIALRYWQGSEMRAADSADGWFHTGDFGEFDAEGNLYFRGRKKNVIVTPAGMNVYPEDLEAAMKLQPEVRDCVVVAIEVEGNAEPMAILLAQSAEAAAPAIAAANNSLAEYQQIRRWAVWPDADFPRTSTGKPRVAQIAEWARSHGASSRPSSDVGDLVARYFAGDVSPRSSNLQTNESGRTADLAGFDSRPSANLESDLNLSSLDRVELLSALENRYQVDLNEARFANAATVSDIQRLVREADVQATATYSYPLWPQRWPITWIRQVIYAAITWPAALIMARPRFVGRERLARTRGPVLVVANHVTYIDVGFIMAALPWRMRLHLATAMRGELLAEYEHPPSNLSWWRRALNRLDYVLLLALFNVFPLPQRSGFLRSFAFAGESADRGYSVLVFPEGKRTETGELNPFQSGVGLLAQKLQLAVVPIRIHGLWEAAQQQSHFVRPGQIEIRIGEPVEYPPEAAAESIARDLERRVREL